MEQVKDGIEVHSCGKLPCLCFDLQNLYRPVRYVSIEKTDHETAPPAIRAYCTQFGQSWAIQVRGPLKLANGKPGKDAIVAHASLNRGDVEALIATLEALLNEDLHRAIDAEFAKSVGEGAPRAHRA